jgi:hypothetical protein
MGLFDLGLGPIAELGKSILEMFPNAEQRQKAADKLQDFAMAVANNQAEINKTEAAHSSIFVAGWRPFIGWTCGLGFVYSTLISPITGLPTANMEQIIAILGGLLGLGTLRTVEKVQGVPDTKFKKKG